MRTQNRGTRTRLGGVWIHWPDWDFVVSAPVPDRLRAKA